MRYKHIFLASCLVSAMIAAPAALRADTNNPFLIRRRYKTSQTILSTLEEQAAGVSRDADTVWSLSQDHHTNWQSHAYYLNNLREDVNSMGRLLAELEEMKPQASAAQQMAIERARPHWSPWRLRPAKLSTCSGRRNLMQPQYKETIADLSRQADILYQTVDTIVDYHNADDRLDNLEASHSGSGI